MLIATLLPAPAPAAAELTMTVAPEYAGGRNGAEGRTNALSIPVGASLGLDRFTLSARIPWLAVSGPGGYVPRIGTLGSSGTDGGARSGLGDLRLTGAYTLLEGETPDGPAFLEIGLQTRLPTATDARLGATQWEHMLLLDAGMALPGGVSIDATIGRRFVPFPRRGWGERDYWTGYGTISLDLPEGWRLGLAASGQDRLPDVATPVIEVGAFMEREIAPDVTLGLIGWQGLTRESAAFSLGLRLSYRFRRRHGSVEE